MFSVGQSELPENSFLIRYRESGAFTDCFFVDIDRTVTLTEYIRAFYTTAPFKLERLILKWAISKPSSDGDVNLLAGGRTDQFAAWHVEERADEQILLSDFRDRTRSWLMSESAQGTASDATRLYFGSAVIPVPTDSAKKPQMGKCFGALLWFHKVYSQILLSSAKRRLLSQFEPDSDS